MIESSEKLKEVMELFIETLTGTVFELKVSLLDTVISIKNKIQRLEGIPVSQQHLIWRSKELEDKSSLEDNEIRDGSTLKLVISMRGGPINTRRVPVEDPSWKEITEYMEANRDEIWDKLPGGRQVTLLVFRDGDQINFFRLVDRGDGTVAPVAETVSVSSMRNVCITEELETVDQRLRENNVTMQKMRSIRKQMDALTLKKKPRKRIVHNRLNPSTQVTRTIHPFRLPPVPGHRVPLVSQSSSVGRSDAVISISSRRPDQLLSQRERAENRSLTGAEAPLESTTSPVVHLAVQSHGYRGISDLRTMPTTTVHGDGVLRVETSCSNSDNDELDSRWSQSSWSTSLVDSRENLSHSESRSGSATARDGTVTLGVLAPTTSDLPTRRHLRGNSQQPAASHASIDNLEQLQQTLAKFDPRISVQASPRARLPRTTNLRSNLESIILGRMTLDNTNGSTKNGSERDYRPKSSPEDAKKFLSLRNSFTRPIRPVRPQVLPIAPTGNVRMQQATNTSGATRKLGSELERSFSDMPNPSNKVTLTATKQRWCPSKSTLSPGNNGTTVSNLKVLPLNASSGAINKTTTESSGGVPDISKDVLKGSGLVTLPSVVVKAKKSHQRCLVCNRKTGLATSYSCRCGGNFCATHRYAETHDCTYDYKSEGRKILEQSNPLVTAQKLPKI